MPPTTPNANASAAVAGMITPAANSAAYSTMRTSGIATSVATGRAPRACPETTLPTMLAPPYSKREALTQAASMSDTAPKKSDMKL